MLQHELTCPACNTVMRYEDGKFYDGMLTGCLRCGTELVLSRDWDDHESYTWSLVATEELENEI